MPIDPERLKAAIEARSQHERAVRGAIAARDKLYDAIVAIHESGASLREIADALGLSHQRIHQIVDGYQPGRWASLVRRQRPRPRPVNHCTFCGRSQAEVAKIVAGPGVYICNHCIEFAGRALETGVPGTDGRATLDLVAPTDGARCSFCGKRRRGVAAMVASGEVRICDGCVDLCREVLARDASSRP